MKRSRWTVAAILVGVVALGTAVFCARTRAPAVQATEAASASVPEGSTLVGQWQTSPGGATVLCDGMSEPIKTDGSSKSANWTIAPDGSTGRFIAKTDLGCKLELVGNESSLKLDKPADCAETQDSGQVQMTIQAFSATLTSASKALLLLEGTTLAKGRGRTSRCKFTGTSTAEKVGPSSPAIESDKKE